MGNPDDDPVARWLADAACVRETGPVEGRRSPEILQLLKRVDADGKTREMLLRVAGHEPSGVFAAPKGVPICELESLILSGELATEAAHATAPRGYQV